MVAAVLLMLLAGFLWAVVGALFVAAPTEKDRLLSFFAISSIVYCAFAFAARPPSAAPAREVLRLAAMIVPCSLLDTLAFLLLKRAMERGSQGIAWCIVQSAMVVPFICMVAFMHNPASHIQWVGLASMLAALALLGLEKQKGGSSAYDASYLLLVLAAFAMLGIALFLRVFPGYAGFTPETMSWRLPLHALAPAVFWSATCFAGRLWRPRSVWRKAVPYGIVVALGQMVFFFAVDAADKLLLTSIATPVAIGTCILLFTLYCHVFRGERLSPAGWAAVALDIAGIAMLSCGGSSAS